MIVHRFMSDAEHEVLKAGGKLFNTTDHHKDCGRSTATKGFCFFIDKPFDALEWLGDYCNTDWCVTFEVSSGLLSKSWSMYAGKMKTEYYTMKYCLDDNFKILEETTRFRQPSDEEIELTAETQIEIERDAACVAFCRAKCGREWNGCRNAHNCKAYQKFLNALNETTSF